MILAHICSNEVHRVQELKSHSENTVQYALERINMNNYSHVIRLSGLFHDLGKYSDAYQDYLRKVADGEIVKRGSVNHTFAGVIYLLEKYHNSKNSEYEKCTSELVAYAVGAHHGLFDVIDYKEQNGFEHRLTYSKEDIQYEIAVRRFHENQLSTEKIEEEFRLAVNEVKQFLERTSNGSKKWYKSSYMQNGYNPKTEFYYLWGLFIRLVTSAVMYGDRVDTSEFMRGICHQNKLVTNIFWKEQIDYFEKKLIDLMNDGQKTQLNFERQRISDECKEFARKGNGVYKLSVPTAAGKTLSTMRYAYTLAEKEGKQRVIFVIPLLSVLEQNSKIIREYTYSKELIGEHHSNIVQVNDSQELLNENQLSSDFWNEPIIITTLYQILMNCFSEKTSYVMRFSALANSIIVIDEAQSIPLRDVHIFDMVVNFLKEYCNTTVVMCSATQPSFENAIYPVRFSEPFQIIPQSNDRNKIFKRVNVHNLVTSSGMSNDEIFEFCNHKISEVNSILIICNTKMQAKKLYEKFLAKDDSIELFHLSTGMCIAHRRDVLKEINECLMSKSNCKLICISTQLVEAGIDFSFQCVIRSLAGIDNIVQAFGRCNRSFEYGIECDAYIVKMKEENLTNLQEIIWAQKSTEALINAYKNNPDYFDNDILGEKSIQYYYTSLFSTLKNTKTLDYEFDFRESLTKETMLSLLSTNENYRKKDIYFTPQSFLTAGRNFKVFDTETVDVIVPYKSGREIISRLCSCEAKYNFEERSLALKEAAQYSIQIWKNQLTRLISDGVIYEVKEPVNFYNIDSHYSREIGFNEDENII